MLVGMIGLAIVLMAFGNSRSQNTPLPDVLGQVAEFTLTNQDGQATTLADLTNQVWVADIIFTRCASSCPIMSRQMKSLQDALPPGSRAKLVTLTCDPSYDTPSILKKYGEHYGADFQRWMFLSGTPKALSGLATGSLKLGVTPVSPQDRTDPTDFFIHSTIFVIVDQQARLRGIFQTGGDGVDWTKIQPQILAAVKKLEGGG
ncbi:MAG TPA: SCO family protein [Verrucomicrobiae bacterium]